MQTAIGIVSLLAVAGVITYGALIVGKWLWGWACGEEGE